MSATGRRMWIVTSMAVAAAAAKATATTKIMITHERQSTVFMKE
jgi:hypothetical protein